MESNIPGRPVFGEGAGQPWPTVPQADLDEGTKSCKRVAVKRFVAPSYPETARLGNVQGTVRLYASLDDNGRVTGVVPSGTEAFYQSALGTLRQWTFQNPSKVKALTVVFDYALEQNSLTADTSPGDVTADLPCEVKVTATPEMPSSSQRF